MTAPSTFAERAANLAERLRDIDRLHMPGTEAWRDGRAATSLAVLVNAIEPGATIDTLDLGDDSGHILLWLAGRDTPTVVGIAAPIDRARNATTELREVAA